MEINKNTSLGDIKYSKEMIKKIAAFAARETYGIVGMANAEEKNGLSEVLSFFDSGKGVKIQKNENNELLINLYIIVQYGVKISVVADNLIEKVRYEVENQLGVKVKKITVDVKGVKVTK